MAASDYTGKEKTSLANIKEMIANATSLEEIRGNMGLGYTLGVLQAANGGTGVSNLQDVADTIANAIEAGASSIVNAILSDYFPLSDSFANNSAQTYRFTTRKIGTSYYATTYSNGKLIESVHTGVGLVDTEFVDASVSEGTTPTTGFYVFKQSANIVLDISLKQSTLKWISSSDGKSDICGAQGMNPLFRIWYVNGATGSHTELATSKSSWDDYGWNSGTIQFPAVTVSGKALSVNAGDRIAMFFELVPNIGNGSNTAKITLEHSIPSGSSVLFKYSKGA